MPQTYLEAPSFFNNKDVDPEEKAKSIVSHFTKSYLNQSAFSCTSLPGMAEHDQTRVYQRSTVHRQINKENRTEIQRKKQREKDALTLTQKLERQIVQAAFDETIRQHKQKQDSQAYRHHKTRRALAE